MVAALSATMLLLPFVTRWKYFVFQGVCFPNELPEAVQELRKAQLLCAAISLMNSRKGNTNECDDQNRRSSRLNATWEALPGRARERAAARNYKKMPRRSTRRPARSGESEIYFIRRMCITHVKH